MSHFSRFRFFSSNLCLIILFLNIPTTVGSDLTIPKIQGPFGSIPDRFLDYEVILQPDKNEPEWWAGAPSVVRDRDGIFWLACRMRTADAPRGLRGYEVRILRSEDGIHFTKVLSIQREEIPIAGFERPALLIDPTTNQFKLYICGPGQNDRWSILKLDDASDPTQFKPTTAKAVIEPLPKSYDRDVLPTEYKDPLIIHAENSYHCYVIGVVRRTERIFHFQSEDGENWSPVGNCYEPVMDLAGWHNFYVRPASMLPLGPGYLFVYEGSHVSWHDPVYNIATGLAFTFDLHQMRDLTPDSPLIKSTTPSEHFHTWRYSHWLYVENEIWIYAEVACPNNTHEIRLYRLPRSF